MELLQLAVGQESCWETSFIGKGKTVFAEWRINKQNKLQTLASRHLLHFCIVCVYADNESFMCIYLKFSRKALTCKVIFSWIKKVFSLNWRLALVRPRERFGRERIDVSSTRLIPQLCTYFFLRTMTTQSQFAKKFNGSTQEDISWEFCW